MRLTNVDWGSALTAVGGLMALSGIAEARTRAPASPTSLGIGMGVLAVVGLGIALWGYLQRAKVAKVKAWPTASGRILSSGVRTETSRSRRGGRSTVHYFDVRYAFSAQGANYESDNFQIGYDNIAASDIPRVQAQYPAGANVTVQYNPANPKESVIETGDNGRALIIVGAIVAALGLAAAAFFLTR